MQHPEEGVIHSYVDGALSPAESAELEAHVGSCGECSARVAEARGLAAASSRIVGHLDFIPGNVIPAAPARRQFSLLRSTWPVAIAAALVIGIGLESTRSDDTPQAASETMSLRDIGKIALPDSVLLAPVSRPAANQAPPSPPSIGPSARRERQVAATDPTAVTAAVPAPQMAKGSAPAAPPPVAASIGEARSDAITAQREMARTSAPAGMAAGAVVREKAAAPSVARLGMSRAMVDRAESEAIRTFVGCYDLNASTGTFPARFALVADTIPATSGLLAVHYVDANGRLSDRILDAGWSTEGSQAVVKTIARGPLLTIARAGGTVAAASPNGPRTGSVTDCSGVGVNSEIVK